MSLPKCTSRWGHKFQGRYSKGPVEAPDRFNYRGTRLQEILEQYRDVTYERDICVRCGLTIEKHSASEGKAQTESTT